MKRIWTLLGSCAVLAILAFGSVPRPAEAGLRGCSVTFCQKCAGDCCPTSTGGCVCVADCSVE